MIDKIELIQNDNVTVGYSFLQEAIIITDRKSSKNKILGWNGIVDLFNCFWNSFSEEITFDDAISFFSFPDNRIFINKNNK